MLGAASMMGQQAQAGGLPSVAAGNYSVTNAKELNSPYLDYSAIPYQNGAIFTSARGGKSVFVCDEDLVTGRYSDLYFAKEDAEGRFFLPEMVRGDLNGKYHDGAVTFSADGKTMYFSRNNADGQNNQGIVDLKIYTAQRSMDGWEQVQELPFNSDDFASCHPSLSADGKLLFFASDRPGGYGGMDIFVVKKDGEKWGQPVNLGPAVNTAGNEIFPFVSASNTLYFASDGRQGLGGLDVYSTLMDGMSPSQSLRLPPPVNSPFDDFSFTADLTERRGFFTSDRPGGKGQDDIYRWKFSGVRPVLANICVVEEKTGMRIEDAKLLIRQEVAPSWGNTETTTAEYVVLYTEGLGEPGQPFDRSCDLRIPVLPGERYVVEVSKAGYLPLKLLVPTSEMTALPEYLVPILPAAKPRMFAGFVKNSLDDSPLPNSKVLVRNRCTGQVSDLTTDAAGSFRLEVDCNCGYEILASKDGFAQNEKQLLAGEINCDGGPTTVAVPLSPVSENVTDLTVGAVIELENVYYDYNQFFIRPDAASDLDHVVDLMNKYPSLEIELGSHTDARGSDSYNEWLSQQRAEAAVQYIVSKGISAKRLIAKGYGETKLTNHCANGVDCDDATHEQNRRTEIKVIRLEEEGVRY